MINKQNAELEIAFKNNRKLVKQEIYKQKLLYYTGKCQDIDHRQENIWQTLNQLTGNIKKNDIAMLHIHGRTITDKKDIVNNFNEYFINVGKSLDDGIPRPNGEVISHHLNIPNQVQFMFLKPASTNEVNKVIAKLKNKKSTGTDGLNVRTIKSVRSILAIPITNLFNFSIQKGEFPNLFKTAKVIPIHKGGSMTQLNNYRPIALLTTLSKIFEKLMYTRLFLYFSKYNLFNSKQFGFRTKRSTIDAILEITEKIRAVPCNKEYMGFSRY